MKFQHETLPQRVVFAPQDAAAALAGEVERLGARRIMLIASKSEDELAERVSADLPVALRHSEVVMHVPVDVAQRARDAAAAASVDTLVSVGGGSTTGLAKAVALTTGLPIVALPTTYAGSEATNVWGLTEGATKTTGVDNAVLPRSIVYDAALTTTLPVELSVASGLNALAHCVDSMWSPRSDPIDRSLAQEGIRGLADGLPRIIDAPTDLPGREQTLYGAYLAAVAFASAGSGMHHKICHVLGGRFNLPHAQTHAVVLPYVLAFNAPHAPEAQERIAAGFHADTADGGLRALRKRVNAPKALQDYGMKESDITDAVAPVLAAIPSDNPRPVAEPDIEALLRSAWEGSEPNQPRGSGPTQSPTGPVSTNGSTSAPSSPEGPIVIAKPR